MIKLGFFKNRNKKHKPVLNILDTYSILEELYTARRNFGMIDLELTDCAIENMIRIENKLKESLNFKYMSDELFMEVLYGDNGIINISSYR